MRKLVENQEKINRLYALVENRLFLEYIDELVENYSEDSKNIIMANEFNDDFTIPGRLEILLDGKKACIEITSDILFLLYQVILIKTENIKGKLVGGEEVDLQVYRQC